MSKEQARAFIIGKNDGKIFTVVFIKRTNGKERKMNCRKGVRKGVTGEGLRFDPIKKGLVPVFDMKADGHRMINLDTVKSIKANKQTFLVG